MIHHLRNMIGAANCQAQFHHALERRLYDLQCASFIPLEIFDAFPGTMADEVTLKRRFIKHRIRGEWYRFDDEIFGFVELGEEFRRDEFAARIFDPSVHTTQHAIWEALDGVPISDFVRRLPAQKEAR